MTTNTNTQYIIERTGWNQWLDDGDRWVSNRDAARLFSSESAAADRAAFLNEEFSDDCGCRVVQF